MSIRLTQYSHGAGCGCKLSPQVLQSILKNIPPSHTFQDLWVGNQSSDDAAVIAWDEEEGVVSTTDFFMPIVDDAFDFGQIAATNAISDIYAMGGKPLMAIAILGWPIDKLGPETASLVLAGAQKTCHLANIPLAGGHSIDAPEPIFGLAVTGRVKKSHLKQNNQAQSGDDLYLTKPLGIGILTTAEKKGVLLEQDRHQARDTMIQLNKLGYELGKLQGVHAMTDITGFGLLGHLIEMSLGSQQSAQLTWQDIPQLSALEYYINAGAIPGGCHRNFASYGHHVNPLTPLQQTVLCDPQTSGGLLIAIDPKYTQQLQDLTAQHNGQIYKIGHLQAKQTLAVYVH